MGFEQGLQRLLNIHCVRRQLMHRARLQLKEPNVSQSSPNPDFLPGLIIKLSFVNHVTSCAEVACECIVSRHAVQTGLNQTVTDGTSLLAQSEHVTISYVSCLVVRLVFADRHFDCVSERGVLNRLGDKA